MAIRGNVGLGTIDVAAGDTTIYDPASTVERYAVSAFSIHNTTAGSITVSVYTSPNLTSASGKRIAQYAISGNQSADVTEIIGNGFPTTTNIIAVASGVGANITASVTTYDAGD